jgi:hypothetical protein
MPSSRPTTIPVIIHLLRQLRPRSILDVGVGFGKWGHLFREYTDINEAERDPARYPRAGWQIRIDGIEGYASYITEMHRYLYNDIHVGDAARILPTLGSYDLVFLGDIIEHFEKRDGKALLERALERAVKAVIVSTPKFETEQEDLCGNELERHRSLWSASDFAKWPRSQVRTIGGDTLIAVLRKGAQPALTFTVNRSASTETRKKMQAARTELYRLIPVDESFILVDEEQLRPGLRHRRVRPFLEKGGIYWGPPADGATAVAELIRLRGLGIRRVAFLWSTLWWLEHYSELRTHLDAHAKLEHQSGSLMIYELH